MPMDAEPQPMPKGPTVNLTIVSPSAGVDQPLRFPTLSVDTSVKQLKEHIRTSLDVQPPAQNQRLIYRGRALLLDDDTIDNIIGSETIKAENEQTMHLVIKPDYAGLTRAEVGPSASGSQLQSGQIDQQPRMAEGGREPMSQADLNHGQRQRAVLGMRGIGDSTGSGCLPQNAREDVRHRGNVPALTSGLLQEGITGSNQVRGYEHKIRTNRGDEQEVYIIYSPDGPSGLLVNHTTSEVYHTAQEAGQRDIPRTPGLAAGDGSLPPAQPRQEEAIQNRAQPNLGHHHAGHPAPIPPLLGVVWPHLWLILKLAFFVWMFTSPGASWSSWVTTICLAIAVFILSTGALSPFVSQAMQAVGRYLQRMLHATHEHRPQDTPAVPRQETNAAFERPDHNGQPAPGSDHREGRQQRGWFSGQLRRAERASLLFIASIAPGVAERHIANMEMEAQQQRESEGAASVAEPQAELPIQEVESNMSQTSDPVEAQDEMDQDARPAAEVV